MYLKTVFTTLIFLFLVGCNSQQEPEKTAAVNERKVGVLLVNHGSESKKWRKMLLNVEDSVRDRVITDNNISTVKTAFMEYTEPSIATRMKEFDEEQYDEVIIVPLFLTVSSHSADDIPTIVGIKSDPKVRENLEERENIEVYRAKAKVTVTPLLDFTTLLKKNILRRVKALDENTENTGVVLVGYGDKSYNQQWEEMMEELGRYLKIKANIDTVAYSWCGHLVDYSPDPTTQAVNKIFELEDRAMVVPLLVAFDKNFQIDIIQKSIDISENAAKVLYEPDAILPDENLNNWVVDIVAQTMENIS